MAREPNDIAYCFRAEWYDEQAGFSRPYNLVYYMLDNTLAMTDLKNNRMFLKRVNVPTVSIDQLFIGAVVTVHARQLKIVDFGNHFTRQALTKVHECVVAVVRPKDMDRIGEIMVGFVMQGFQICRVKSVRLTGQQAAAYSPENAAELSSGPVVAMEIVGEGVAAAVQESLGLSLDPANARADGDFFFKQSLPSSAKLADCSLCIIKPHIVGEGAAYEIVNILQREGLQVSAIQRMNIELQAAKEFFDVYFDVVPHANAMVEELQSGACIAVEVVGADVHKKLRTLCGPMDPEIARHLRPNTIRAQYGKDNVYNAVHCTDLETDGPLESDLIFNSCSNCEVIKAAY
jgi:nucleoside-diphosphate kinase